MSHGLPCIHISERGLKFCITPLNPPLLRREAPVLPLTLRFSACPKGFRGLEGVRQLQTLVSSTCVYTVASLEEGIFFMVKICLDRLKRWGLLGLVTLNPTHGVAITQSAPFPLPQQRPIFFGRTSLYTRLPFRHTPHIRAH